MRIYQKPGRYGRIVGDRCLRQRPGLVHFNGLAAWPLCNLWGNWGSVHGTLNGLVGAIAFVR